MVFPIGDDQIERGYTPLFSYSFIAINLAIFVWQFSMADAGNEFINTWGAIPQNISSGSNFETLFTSIFLHGGWANVLGNMLFLWIFADNIEATIGNFKFVIFYLLGGLVAGLAQIAIDPSSEVPCVGASGAIAAVMGAYIIMFPKSRVKMFFILFFNVFYIPAWVFLGFWFAQQLTSGFGVFDVTGESGGNVAWWAHIGGFAFGLVAGFIFRQMYVTSHHEYDEPVA
jgi:membrane associated rhomboid family serine protease